MNIVILLYKNCNIGGVRALRCFFFNIKNSEFSFTDHGSILASALSFLPNLINKLITNILWNGVNLSLAGVRKVQTGLTAILGRRNKVKWLRNNWHLDNF